MSTRLVPLVLLLALPAATPAADLPKVTKVDFQPLAAQTKRLLDALDYLGSPLPEADRKALDAARNAENKADGIAAIQAVLDKHCLAGVVLGESKIETVAGPAKPELAEQGWRVFLVKVINPDGVDKLELKAESPNALPLVRRSTGSPDPKVTSVGQVEKRFLELMTFNSQPLVRQLSGLELEYRLVQVYCRDAGRREGSLGFGLWRDTNRKFPAPPQQRVRGSNQVVYLFESVPAVLVKLGVRDVDGKPTMASFTFRDDKGHVYPSQSRRLAPDFFFHAQVYRSDGETVLLQPGKYTVSYTRGPEYLVLTKDITVPKASTHAENFDLKRWVHPAKKGWWSGDHHIHAAGCAHYESPTEGVTPEDMMRHVLGEDLNVGCCLSWGPCWYHQKRYFEGKVSALSTASHLLRYDVEVSGFPSSHAGHICLLRLRQQDYPGTKLINDWPSWDLPIFKWAKSQGAVVGFAHSGWGLDVGTGRDLPTYTIPPYNGIGANEYIVDVTHNLCDFISTVDTPAVWELNIWYHTLNCGYRCRVSGETDFPCIFGDRVGLGRSYVHLDGKLDFDRWAEGIKRGRCYVSDGKSHLMDFSINDTGVGLNQSEVKLAAPGKVQVKARVAAYLEPKPTPQTEAIRNRPLNQKPYWDVEKARLDDTRKVPVEVVVNGYPVDKKEIVADGSEQEVTFEVPVKHSSWVCLRVFPSSHTNPIFVLVDDKPIRASKRSAEWCLKSVDRCWEQKKKLIREAELADAKSAYDFARKQYKKIVSECVDD
ncbi:MAG: CehA/McbA family metallohydrolase [Planctomycetes bacterium]|nr:CehA/McbA family metallohydrolase [Planctomycetota bacterium]